MSQITLRFVVLFVCFVFIFFTESKSFSFSVVVRISICCFLLFTDPDPDYRNPASLLVRPLNSLVYSGGFPVLHVKVAYGPQHSQACN